MISLINSPPLVGIQSVQHPMEDVEIASVATSFREAGSFKKQHLRNNFLLLVVSLFFYRLFIIFTSIHFIVCLAFGNGMTRSRKDGQCLLRWMTHVEDKCVHCKGFLVEGRLHQSAAPAKVTTKLLILV